MSEQPNVKIYVCHHKNSPRYQNECLIPIWAGKAISNEVMDGEIIGDDTLDNISAKNKTYCEMTVLYWMWKNVEADYYGLFHYRRLLNFNRAVTDFHFAQFDEETINKFGWHSERIKEVCEQYDIISSGLINVFRIDYPEYLFTNYEQYSHSHNSKDIDIAMSIIKEKYPEMYPASLRWLHSKDAFYCNMLIMKKEYFHPYCAWLFDVLFELEKRLDISHYDDYQKRAVAFLSERLANCYMAYLQEKESNLRYTQRDIVYGTF